MKQSGFTLIELLVVAVIMAFALSAMTGLYAELNLKEQIAYEESAFEKNRAVGLGILKYANETTGRLPAPYSGKPTATTYASAPLNPEGTDAQTIAIQNNIESIGIPGGHVVADGSMVQNVRVYQRVAGLTTSLPVRGISGDSVIVTYDIGVVYQTQCPQASTCNSGIPGSSIAMTSANYSTWVLTAPDLQEFNISTLEHQKILLDLTMDNVAILIRRIQNDYAYRAVTSAPNDPTNFYMGPNNSGAPNLSVASATTNDGCYDGWYSLAASNVNVLERYGLNKSTYATTGWGGTIEYCRDYDPVNSGKNQVPHSAAIRFNRNVTSASAPVAGQNIVIAI